MKQTTDSGKTFGRAFTTWLVLVGALAAAIGFLLGARLLFPAAPPQLTAITLYPTQRELPDFHLTRDDGQSLTHADWMGHWTIAYFGFTNCPDVCPTTLAALHEVWKQLATQGKTQHLRIDFISVDPERDTPGQLSRYVDFFSPDFVAATGSDQQLALITAALGLVYSRTHKADGSIDVEHSASAVLINPQGRQAGLLRPPFEPEEIARDLATLMDSR